MEAKVLVEVLRQLDRGLTIIENDVIKVATKVPAKAFEAYIKGLLTPESQLPTREGYFKNAMRLYSEAKAAETEADAKIYADVALELGHFYLNQKQYQNAITHFSQVISAVEKCNEEAKKVNKRAVCKDNESAEAAFYTGLIYWQQENYEQALAVLTPLADNWKLTSVYNTLGAIAVQASRAEKKDKTKAANNLNRGLDFLKKASESDPDEIQSRFNYSVALFLTSDFSETIQQIRPVLALNQRDGEAYYLLAKALEKNGDAAAVEFDTQARKYASNYAKLETEWARAKTIEGLNLRVIQPPRKDFVSVVLIKKQNTSNTQNPVNETDTLLEQARAFFKAGKEDDAMQLLSRILAGDPMNAEAYLLRGKIFIKRINWDEAANQLKTALFYDNRLIEAHIILAKIFLEKKDCQQAQSYVASALAIDENNQEALGLQRQVERCSK